MTSFLVLKKCRIELYFDDMEKQAYHFNEWLSYRKEDGKLLPTLKLVYEVSRKNGRIIPSRHLCRR